MIICRTPLRVSFFGGGTDYPAYYLKHGGSVLATTINKYSYILCRHLPPFFEHHSRVVYSKIERVKQFHELEHPSFRAVLMNSGIKEGVEIHYDGDLPAKSGLGTSSAFTVGLLNSLSALQGKHISKRELADKALYIEQDVLKEHVGSQDQISAAYGGFNRIDFGGTGYNVSPLILTKHRFEELQQSLMLFFTGFSRIADPIAKSQIDNFGNTKDTLTVMHQMVDEGANILQKDKPLDEFGRLLHQGWSYKRTLSSQVSTPQIDDIYHSALRAGASGGKLLGAGGGGFILLFVSPHLQMKVKEALARLIHVPFQFESCGSKIVIYQPNGLN